MIDTASPTTRQYVHDMVGETSVVIIDYLHRRHIATDQVCVYINVPNDEDVIYALLQRGAKGLVLQTEQPNKIKYVVCSVERDGAYYDGLVAELFARLHYLKPAKRDRPLTVREQQIYDMITEGYTAQEIADKLFVSTRTVDTHLSNMRKKTGHKTTLAMVIERPYG